MTRPSLHFASVLNWSPWCLKGLRVETMNVSCPSSKRIYFKVTMTVSGNRPTVLLAITEAQANSGDKWGFSQMRSCATKLNRPRNSTKSLDDATSASYVVVALPKPSHKTKVPRSREPFYKSSSPNATPENILSPNVRLSPRYTYKHYPEQRVIYT